MIPTWRGRPARLGRRWRNVAQPRRIPHRREQIIDFLTRKWAKEREYRLRKQLWAFHENRIAVRFQYEWRDAHDHWWRSHGNELWEFTADGLMSRREASINDIPIAESDRTIVGPDSASI